MFVGGHCCETAGGRRPAHAGLSHATVSVCRCVFAHWYQCLVGGLLYLDLDSVPEQAEESTNLAAQLWASLQQAHG